MEAANTTSHDLDDIQNLLQLESIKRYTDEAKNMQRQTEEHARNFIEAKREYHREFACLVNLCKQVTLCKTLNQRNTNIIDSHVPSITAHLADMNAALTKDKRPTEINMESLDKCKEQLQSKHPPRNKLTQYHQNFANNCEALKTLYTMLENVETDLEMSTLAAMDQMLIELQPPKTNPDAM